MTDSPGFHRSLLFFHSVVFDFDGTLVDSNSVKRFAFIDVNKKEGVPSKLSEEILDSVMGDRTQLYQVLAKKTGHDDSWATQMERNYTVHCENQVAAAPEIPGASRVLNTLSENKITAYLCSNTPTDPLIAVVKRRKMDGYFKRVIGGPTPKPVNLQNLISTEKLLVEKTLMVGDNDVDRDAASFCGLLYAGLTNSFSDYKQPLLWKLDRLDDLLK